MARNLADLLAAAAAADGPDAVDLPRMGQSSIDPCGLRETNFDMMNMVADGLNNVARHVRPFVLVAWAWRRALQLAEKSGAPVADGDVLVDFVARTEVIFAWSLFLNDRNADLPGGQALAPVLSTAEYDFGSSHWQKFRDARRDSTSLSAAVNYGPGLKSLRWLVRNAANPKVSLPAPGTGAALDAFEHLIVDRLDHPAFASLGPALVTREEALAWSEAWSLANLTDEERAYAARTLAGDLATATRASGVRLALAAAEAEGAGPTAVATVRNTMTGEAAAFVPPHDVEGAAAAWRRLQFRQLFRFAVEALLAWTLDRLAEGPRDSRSLSEAFIEEAGLNGPEASAHWLDRVAANGLPSAAISRLAEALRHSSRQGLAAAIADGVALAVANAPERTESFDREDRLPLRRAKREAEVRRNAPARDLAQHMIESWAIAQHVYWAVGRGLQDARRGGRTLLRLKLVMDEGGWTSIPGRAWLSPAPTPDRLQTMLSLAAECGLLGDGDAEAA